MILEGVYVQAALCTRVAVLLWAQIREDERRNGRAAPAMIALAQELASVGRVHRMRETSAQRGKPGNASDPLNAVYSMTSGPVAEQMGVSVQMVRKLCRNGELPGQWVKGHWRFDPADIEALRTERDDWHT